MTLPFFPASLTEPLWLGSLMSCCWPREHHNHRRHVFSERVSAGVDTCRCSLVSSSRMGPQFRMLHECSCRCSDAASAGDLKFLQSRNHPLDRSLCILIGYYAAGGGHLAVLQCLQSPALDTRGQHICRQAAAGGHLVVLRWARGQGCAWDSSTCGCSWRRPPGSAAVRPSERL